MVAGCTTRAKTSRLGQTASSRPSEPGYSPADAEQVPQTKA
jgi:hypothetical protein